MTFHAPEDIATVLNIKPSTLRKYSLLLEQSGYLFKKMLRVIVGTAIQTLWLYGNS